MPQFLTISPTHVPGKKVDAWEKFLTGGYVAIGWLHDVDLTGKPLETVVDTIRSQNYENESSAIRSFERFLALRPGDFVAVNNTNHGLFGVGEVKSTYKFEQSKHDSGAVEPEQFYSHYVDVSWIVTKYTPRKAILAEGESAWQPYGTTGALLDHCCPKQDRVEQGGIENTGVVARKWDFPGGGLGRPSNSLP